MALETKFSNRFLSIYLLLVLFVTCFLFLIPFYNTDIILLLQNASPTLDGVFIAISYLGEPLIAIIIIVILYWIHDRVIAKNLTYFLLFSVYSNNFLKNIFQDPRPTINQIVSEKGFGFPSGHAQNATVTWGFLAYQFKKARWFTVIAIVLIALIALSRLYLGVHDLQDVLGGLLIGSILLLTFLTLQPTISRKINQLSLQLKLGVAMIIPILLFVPVLLAYPSFENDFGLACGALLGISIGYLIETNYIKLDYNITWGKKVIRALLGIILVFSVYFLFELIEPADAFYVSQVYKFLSYASLALIGAIFAPWLFQKLKI